MKKIKVATRKSILALKQTQIVVNMLKNNYPDIDFKIISLNTKGDENQEKKLSEIGTKGLFTHEIEQLLIKKEVDMAVHSLKDMPTQLDDNLQISAYIKRHSHKDVIIFSPNYKSIDELPYNAKIGTSSLRREVQMKKLGPNFNIINIRGNINTRLEKMEKEKFDGIILAKAGLERLDILKEVSYQELPFIPAAAQGCICVETTKNNKNIISMLECIDDKLTRVCTQQERDFLSYMGGGCNVAMGAYCSLKENKYNMSVFIQADKINKDNLLDIDIKHKNRERKKGDYCRINHCQVGDNILIYGDYTSFSYEKIAIKLAQEIIYNDKDAIL